MGDKENYKIKNEIVSVWFGFRLNKTTSVVLLILSFLGVMSLPAIIFLHISDFILYINRLADFYGIIQIVFYSVCFSLSLYTFLKVIDGNKIQEKEIKALESRDSHVLWFGVHLTYSQALLLFALSLTGIIFTSYYSIMLIIDHARPYYSITYLNLDTHFINIVFLIICIFTVYRIKKSQIKSENAKKLNKFSLFLFIFSIVIFIFSIYPTLITSIPLIYIIFNGSFDFSSIIYLIILIICISLLVLSALNIKRKYNFSLTSKKSSTKSRNHKWFGIIKLNPIIALMLLSLSIFVASYLLFDLGIGIFIFGLVGIDFHVIFLLLFCFYTMNFILKKNRLDFFLESYCGEKFPMSKWFGLKVNKSQRTIIFWLSVFSTSYLIYHIINLLLQLPMILDFIELFPEIFGPWYIVRISIILIIQCLMLMIYFYSMIIARKIRKD